MQSVLDSPENMCSSFCLGPSYKSESEPEEINLDVVPATKEPPRTTWYPAGLSGSNTAPHRTHRVPYLLTLPTVLVLILVC